MGKILEISSQIGFQFLMVNAQFYDTDYLLLVLLFLDNVRPDFMYSFLPIL